jgi:hypothetical protein
MHLTSLLTKFLLEHPDWAPDLELTRDDRVCATGLRTASGYPIGLREVAMLAAATPKE